MTREPEYPQASGDCNFTEQQLFGAYYNPDTDVFYDTTNKAAIWRSSCMGTGSLWRIQSRERSVLRLISGATATSLTRGQIDARLDAGDGGGESVDQQGPWTLLVTVAQSRGVSYQFRMDANQSAEVYARGVSVELYASPTTVLVSNGATETITSPATNALYADTLVGVDIQQIEASLTQEPLYYTQTVTVESTAEEIVVPERATAVRITTADSVSAWGAYVGNPTVVTGAPQTQTISFTSGVAEVEIGNETHLQTDAGVSARDFQLRWTIRP